MLLKISEVNENHIKTEFLKDRSYIAKYIQLLGTEIQFNPINPDQTQVTLTIHYQRLLDPAWYFDPLQKMAIKQTAQLLIK
jgi:hypothetical protein